FARGCMRTYLMLREKARRFHDDPEIAEALQVARAHRLAEPTSPGGLTPDALQVIRSTSVDPVALGGAGYGHERLDQLVTELLLGVR
ncbi:MAG: hypothetical protein RI900_2213, partial [Actinomycetota bacterium]